MYHGVVRRIQDVVLDRWAITEREFADHLKFITDHYAVIPLAQALSALASGSALPQQWAVLTFDDAFRNIYDRAAPLLREFGVPYTIAVPTGLLASRGTIWSCELALILLRCRSTSIALSVPHGPATLHLRGRTQRLKSLQRALESLRYVDDQIRWEWLAALHNTLGDGEFDQLMDQFQEYRLMSVAQVQELCAEGAALASHGHLHVPLAEGQPDHVLQREIGLSKSLLEDVTRSPIDCFVYPYGVASASACSALHSCGYRFAFTSLHGYCTAGDDLLRLPRIAAECTTAQLRYQLSI
jgi:peptidoglycan/xylan/chitin deacetylase (PgdA/CDA1 family)